MSTKRTETFIGPCSKYITGQGWTTEIPIEQIESKGYAQKAEIERLTEEKKTLVRLNQSLKKQVDELTDKLGKVLSGIKADEFLTARGVEQAVKDTAKEILQGIMHIIKKSDGFLAQEVVRIMAEQKGVEVE